MKMALGGSTMLALALAVLTGLAGCQKAATNTAAPPAAIAANAPPAAAQPASTDADDVKAFLDGVYAHYKTNSPNSTYQPFDSNAGEVLAPDTLALMKADEKALNGELGDIDADWLCMCQDYTSIKATIAVQSASATTAKATSAFHDVDDASAKPRRDTFDLVKTPAGWRIQDMGTEDQPSLRKVLQDEIKRLKAGGKATGGSD
jgi:hypothetical protein